jgi:restriction system protein
MTSQTFQVEGRQPGFRLEGRGREPQERGKDYASGWLFLGLLTAVVGGWYLYRLFYQPEWPAALPSSAAELLRLAELASAFTLLILWSGLLWHRRAGHSASASGALGLEQMYELSPRAFEQYVGKLFRRKGYRVVFRGRSGDHGVDLELTSGDGRRAVVQCKRYRDTVGEEIVRGLFGTLLHETAHHAFLVTTADISEAARQWAAGKPMTLIDGPTLASIAAAIDDRSGR